MQKRLFVAVTVAGAAAALYYALKDSEQGGDAGQQDDGVIDSAMTKVDEIVGMVSGPGPVADMVTSPAMLSKLKRRESLSLTPYNLGDGGWTIGFGHFEKTRDALPNISTRADAEALFAQDVAERAEKWVKLYVRVPLTQNQFDALVSIAFNMSPRSFKKFADEVNAGNGIDAIAEQSVAWVDPKFQRGIANRRDDEMRVFNEGVYA